jgi:hypothetical protein
VPVIEPLVVCALKDNGAASKHRIKTTNLLFGYELIFSPQSKRTTKGRRIVNGFRQLASDMEQPTYENVLLLEKLRYVVYPGS